MIRRSGRGRILKKDGALEIRQATLSKPTRQTRSQPSKGNQEIEVQHEDPVDEKEKESVSNIVDNMISRNSLSREGSLDSAISSHSSKWSVSSNVSVISRMSTCVVTSRIAQTLDSIAEERTLKVKNDVTPDILNWISSLSAERARAATPLVRTHAVANGQLMRQTVSRGTESSSSDSGYNSKILDENYSLNSLIPEAVIHIYVFAYWGLILSTNQCLRSASKLPLAVHPIISQVAGNFFLGILCDITSPKLALLIPQVICILVGLQDYFANEALGHLTSYLPFLNTSLFGSQFLAVRMSSECSRAGVLSRVSLSYGLAAIVCPSVVNITVRYLGSSINYQLVTLVSLLSMMAVLRLLASNSKGITRLLPPDLETSSWTSFIGCVIMKLAVAIPTSLLLPWLQSILKDGSSIEGVGLPSVVTLGLLCTQAIVVPSLLLCTAPSTIIWAMASLLTLLYSAMMLLEESSSFLLVLLVPICGLVGVTQNLVVTKLISSFSCFPGVLVATSLAIHTLTRYFSPQFLVYLTTLCTENRTDMISLTYPRWFSQIMEGGFLPETFLPLQTSIGILFCHNVNLNILAVTGCLCSILLLVVAQII
ncbi:uncharacterized protein [Panulirus ornatus]|uniref:uncharacterized protein isoform X1 n=1 Tax=Panulirus ornatus TaxID=150431 RepID=UPI003A8621F5